MVEKEYVIPVQETLIPLGIPFIDLKISASFTVTLVIRGATQKFGEFDHKKVNYPNS
jgi:hypothetical protein